PPPIVHVELDRLRLRLRGAGFQHVVIAHPVNVSRGLVWGEANAAAIRALPSGCVGVAGYAGATGTGFTGASVNGLDTRVVMPALAWLRMIGLGAPGPSWVEVEVAVFCSCSWPLVACGPLTCAELPTHRPLRP